MTSSLFHLQYAAHFISLNAPMIEKTEYRICINLNQKLSALALGYINIHIHIYTHMHTHTYIIIIVAIKLHLLSNLLLNGQISRTTLLAH